MRRSARELTRRKDGAMNVREDGDVRYRQSVNERFNKALEQQIDGTLPEGHIYQLGLPGEILRSTGIPDLPIELSSTRLAEKAAQKNHPFDISEVKDLVRTLNNPIAVFKYGDDGKAQNVIVNLQANGKNFLVGIHFNRNERRIEINDIRGLFPKDTAEWLNWIAQGKLLYADKEKIQALIDQQRINLAEVDYLNLDSITNIAKEFENLTAGGENVRYRLAEEEQGIFIQLSRDGSYWNINSAGIFKKKYSRRKPKVYSVPAVGESTNTDTPEVDSDRYEGVIAPAGNSSKTSDIKDNEFSEENQGQMDGNAVQSETPQIAGDVAENPVGRSLNAEEADMLISQMEQSAEVAPEMELNFQTWSETFDETNSIETPIGRVKMGDNQLTKFFAKGREKEFGMVAPTLLSPDVIVEKEAPSANAERNTKYLFIKTFVKPDGSRYVHFESVTVQKDGMEVSISSHEADRKVIIKEMQNGKILHLNERLSFSSEMYLTKTPN